MKNLLYILLFVPLAGFGQTIEDFSAQMPVTDNNMSVVFVAGTLIDFSGGLLQAYVNGNPVSNADYPIQEDGAAGVAVIGTDALCGCDLADGGVTIEFAILMNGEAIVMIDVNPPVVYLANSFYLLDGNTFTFTIDGATVVHGCTDAAYLEYDASANLDDGSCAILAIYGCMNDSACNYYSEANFDDGSCIYAQQYYDCENVCLEDADLDGVCDELEIPGCQDPIYLEYNPSATENDFSCNTLVVYGCTYTFALNFNSLANVNDGSCLVEGCTEHWADNFDDLATENDGSCYKMGCTENWADNYDDIATENDGSCYKYGCTENWADNFDDLATENDGSCYKYGCTEDWAENYDEYATIDDESCYRYGCTSNLAVNYDEYATIDNDNCDFDIITHLNMSFDAWNVSVDLSAGWNMFGYGCPSPIDVIEGLSNHTESIEITKDNNGAVYMPEWGFNGIGDFTPGFGYQIKVTEAIEGFSLCDWYVNDIPEDNIIGLSAENSLVSDSLIVLLNQNCIHEGYCGYSEDYDACYYSNQGYDCDGNFIPQIGHEVMGGILFYYDEDLNRGLVVAQEDAGNAPWGCFGFNVNGLNSSIGSGLNNSILITQQCDEIPNAAQLCLEYESNGYSDWYLPSYEELLLMWSSVGQGAQYIGNVAYFNDGGYWSSNQQNITDAKFLFFDHFAAPNYITNYSKGVTLSVRPIRSFGSWDLGCTDSNADNYDPDANADDGSCDRLGCMSDWAGNFDDLATSDDGSCDRLGCMSDWADNYDYLATTDDGSCDRLGCMSDWADNYDYLATTDDGSCDRLGCMSDWADNYDGLATTDDGSCDRLGCMAAWADNYDLLATSDDGSCDRLGCISEWADNYDDLATTDDGSCDRLGCISEWADNFDSLATTDNGSCLLSACPYDDYVEYNSSASVYNISLCQTLIVFGCIDEQADNFDSTANTDDSSCIYLGCIDEQADNFDSTANTDDNSCVYLGCMNVTADNYYPLSNQDDGSCIIYGCTLAAFPNFNPEATIDDYSCDMNSSDVFGCSNPQYLEYSPIVNQDNGTCNILVVHGCTDYQACNFNINANTEDSSCTYAEQFYDCEGNITEYVVGMEVQGGIVFYVDEYGEHGLVAALEDLPGLYPFGCHSTMIGATYNNLGGGYFNTSLITASACSQIGPETAASAAVSYQSNGYSDWHLPSLYELELIFTTIGALDSDWYWSSTEANSTDAYQVSSSVSTGFFGKTSTYKVRPIRSF